MKIWKLLSMSILLGLLAACGMSKEANIEKPEKAQLVYTCSPNLQAALPYIQVTFQAHTDENGELLLGYPDSDWGQTDMENCIVEFEVLPKASSEFQKDSNQFYIKGEPKQMLTFSYKIVQDFTGDLLNKDTYRPLVNPNYFHVFGKNLFLLPFSYFEDENVVVDANVYWNLPDSSFEIVNSFGMGIKQNFLCTYNDIYSSVFMGGNLNSYVATSKDQKVVFSTPDSWKHIDTDTLNQDLNAIIRQQRDFWNDYSTPLQTVTLLKTHEACPSENDCSYSVGGTGLTNSFATFSSDNPAIGNDRLNWLFAHELFHHWVGTTIRNESEEKEYWFSEGFTDYYAYKLLLRNGTLTLEKFIEEVNTEVIQPHYTSPHKDAANSEITAERFWSDYNWEKLPYRRGWLYAFYLDTQIKLLHPDKSLDDAMRAILTTTRDQDLLLNAGVFTAVLEPFANRDFQSEFSRFIENGEAIDLRKMNIPGIHFSEGEIPLMQIQKDIPLEETLTFLTQ